MIKLLIADDHAIFRAGLKQILYDDDQIEIVDEASDGIETMNKIRAGNFDLILLDISMPGESGMDVLRHIKKEYPDLPVLMLSFYPENQYAVRALKEGAAGYLTKDSDPAILMKAIRKVYRGGKYISASIAESLANYVELDSKEALYQSLSHREFQVMLLIVSGKKNKEIADELNLSEKTVSTYRTRILNKINVRNDVELTIYAIKNKLID